MNGIDARLRGGDRRSIGAANMLAREAETDPRVAQALIAGLESAEPLVRMRCADALEKLTRRRPEWLVPLGERLLLMIEASPPKEVLWHLLQMLPRLRWTPPALERAFVAAQAGLSSASRIVCVNALQALFELTQQAPQRRDEVGALLGRLARTGSPAIKARAAKLLRELPGR